MKNKVGKYLIITLLLLLGLCCVGVLYLFFVPGSNLFGITYISYSRHYKANGFSISKVSTVVVNSYNYDVKILPTKEEEIYIDVYNNSFGFVMQQNKDVVLVPELKYGTLTFDISEPSGFSLNNNSTISLYIPEKSELNLKLTNNGALTTISSNSLNINNFSYSTNHGALKLESCKILGDIDLDLNDATCIINSDVETNENNLTLSIKRGKLEALDSVFNSVNVKSNARGVIKLNICKDIEMLSKTAGGRIEINQVQTGEIKTSDTNVNITEVTIGIIIDLTKSGNVTIANILNEVQEGSKAITTTISTVDGNIKIDKCMASAMLQSTHGNISVNNAYLTIDTKNVYGNIYVNFANDAESYADNSSARTFISVNKNGKTTCIGTDHASVSIDKTGVGSANITFNEVHGNNNFTSDAGSFIVKVDKTSIFNLKILTTSGNVKANLTQSPVYGGWTDKEIDEFINCNSSSNIIDIKSVSGSITVLDSNFY